jgi:hypothetical protein
MKNVYIVSILNAQNQMVNYTIVAASMTAAIGAAQEKAGVTHDPQSFQKMTTIDLEVA